MKEVLEYWSTVELEKDSNRLFANTPTLHLSITPKRRSKKYSDPNRKKVMDIIASMRKENATYQEIAERLELENLKTFSGRGKWHAQTVHRLCQE